MRLLIASVFFLFASSSVTAHAKGFKTERRGNPVVKIKTNHGDIFVELFPKEAPKTVKNFIGLATGKKTFTDHKTGKKVKRKFYDGLTFHRVIKNFMLQGGDPLGTGSGGPGYKFEDEINAQSLGLHKIKALDAKMQPHPHLLVRSKQDFYKTLLGPLVRKLGIKSEAQFKQKYDLIMTTLKSLTLMQAYQNLGYVYSFKLKSRPPKRGMLCMANAGPNTNGSQFFINLIDTPWLMGKHTVFGKVIKGMKVVDKIALVPTDNSKPKAAVKILSIRVVKR